MSDIIIIQLKTRGLYHKSNMSISGDYKKKLQFILNQMENRNQLFQVLEQILVKVQFYQLPLHKITQILKLLQMPEVSDPGQIKYNTFVGISKLYQKVKDKIALHIYQDKFSFISKEMKELLYTIFLNISQIMSYRQTPNLNINPYYNMPYVYSSLATMQPRMMPESFYLNMPNANNSLLKDQTVQNPYMTNQDYRNYYQDPTKYYYNALLHQNSQMMNNPYLIPVNNTQKTINSNNISGSNQNSVTTEKSSIGNPNNISNNNIMANQGQINYSNNPGQYSPHNSYMDYLKAFQQIQQNSYIYSANNQQKFGNMMYKGYPPYQVMPENTKSQMINKNIYYQQKQSSQALDEKKKHINGGKNTPEVQSQSIRYNLPKPNITAPNPNYLPTHQQITKKTALLKTQNNSKNIADPEIQIIPKAINNTKDDKRLTQQNKQFEYCACKGYYAYEDFFSCCVCKRNFHNKCLNQSVRKSQESKAKIECSICKINNIDPLNKVQKIIGQYFLVNLTEQKFQATVNFKHFQPLFFPQKNAKYQIQMRCIRAGDHLDHLQITWPDQCIIKINGEKIIDIPALQSNSSLKKRKDYSVILTQNIYGKHIHENANILQKVRISLEIKSLTPQQLLQKKIKNDFTFVLGIYLIQKLNIDELYQKVIQKKDSKSEKQDYFKYLMFTNQNSEQNQVQIQQVTINLFDPFSWQLIQVPARGSRCHHGSCFDLKTFISFMSTAKNRTWKCPICGKDARKFIIDVQQQQILKKAAELNPIPKQACVFKDSTIAFKIDNESDDQSQKSKKPSSSQVGKTKKIFKDKKEESK